MLKIRTLLYSLFFTATWEGILYVTVGGINLRPYEALLAIIVLILLLKRRYTFDILSWVLLLYVVSGIPSLFNSQALSFSLNTLFFQLIMVFIALSVRNLLNTSTKLEDAIKVWSLVIGNIVNLFGLLEFGTWAIGLPILPQFAPQFYSIARPYSFFIEPNFYGNFLASQIGLLCVLWLTPAFRTLRLWITGSLLLAIILLFLNQSRGPWIGLLFALAIFIFGRYIRRGKMAKHFLWGGIAFLYIIIMIITFFYVASPEAGEALTQRLMHTINPLQEGAAKDRLYDIQLALQVFQRSPFIGNGLGNWGLFVGNEGRGIATPPRNIFVAWLAEKGITGLVIGFAMLWTIISRTKASLKIASHASRMTIWTCFTGWLAVFFTFQFTYLEISPFYWIVTGFLFAAQDLALYNYSRYNPRKVPNKSLLNQPMLKKRTVALSQA